VKAPASAACAAPRHYENFPVASWLCPAPLRPPVAAIYWFARTADDLADEGDIAPAQRLADLEAYGDDLAACAALRPVSPRWQDVFEPLGQALRQFALPLEPLRDLLSAFRQDVVKTRDGAGYANRSELLDYCARSANPIGRLLLHLYGVENTAALAQSDSICSALQLANFWQDLSIDLPHGRFYLPAQDCREHGLDPPALASWPAHPHAGRLVAAEVQWARALMEAGAPLVHRVPGRAGWELRLVVQGGLRILDRVEATSSDIFRARPRLAPLDLPLLLWRGVWM
jgi:squalene synthase HpnC